MDRWPVFVRCFAQFVKVSFSEVAHCTQVVVEILVFVYLQLCIIYTSQVCTALPPLCRHVSAVADGPTRRDASRASCCTQKWALKGRSDRTRRGAVWRESPLCLAMLYTHVNVQVWEQRQCLVYRHRSINVWELSVSVSASACVGPSNRPRPHASNGHAALTTNKTRPKCR